VILLLEKHVCVIDILKDQLVSVVFLGALLKVRCMFTSKQHYLN